MFFRSSMSLLLFCLSVLSIIESGVLKSLSIIVLFFWLFLNYLFLFSVLSVLLHIFWGCVFRCIYVCSYIFLVDWSFYHYEMFLLFSFHEYNIFSIFEGYSCILLLLSLSTSHSFSSSVLVFHVERFLWMCCDPLLFLFV